MSERYYKFTSHVLQVGTNLDKPIDRTNEEEKRGYSQTEEHELYVPRYAVGYARRRKHCIHVCVPTGDLGFLWGNFTNRLVRVEAPNEVCCDKRVDGDGGYGRKRYWRVRGDAIETITHLFGLRYLRARCHYLLLPAGRW